MELVKGRLEEVVFETPDPVQQGRSAVSTSHPSPLGAGKGLDTSAARSAFDTFAKKEAETAVSDIPNGHQSRRRCEFEAGARSFEPPEQRLARLQAEVADLLSLTEKSASKDPTAAAELLGADPSAVSTELKVLEQRLAVLAKDGQSWRGGGQAVGKAGCTMAASLVGQLERLANGAIQAPPAGSSDGRVTYEISYAPSASSIVDSAKIATMESSVADIERQLGVLEPSSTFPDLQTAVAKLEKRVALLDGQKLDSVSKGLDKVLRELQQVLDKKAELDGSSDKDLDRKVSQLFDFCHRWSATAASLPVIVARLHSLQALHLQSASFSSRLAALEQQQEELARLLETTSTAVQDLGQGLKENMTIVRDNMRSLEEKIVKAVRA
eukprot:TRINITY_DN39879_c0_g1_i1.p1 TRINITY_DN39879_c0_g1~~TRINITY_DN39879_c0_g1_i1.p1  ORF type:complete len:383 (+),score=119.32 TRINITY_DN39879_c0_g1_i1:32-1180(+)